jgi:branched-chain amino acid transport system ATP-binding protein
MRKWLSHPVLQISLALLALSLLTLVTPLPISRVTEVAISTLYSLGIILLVGYIGLVPFGGAVFFGIAAYAAGIVTLRMAGFGEFAGMAFAVVFATVIAVLVGALILRRRGLYFSLLTVACCQISFEIAFKWTDLTGGENGLQRIQRSLLSSPLAYHLFVVVAVIVVYWLMWRLAHSPLGRLFQAVRDNERRVASLGYWPYPIKLAAFIISAAITGFAGALMTFLNGGAYANPLSWEHAADPVLMSVLGGVHHLLGAFWGAALFILLEDQLSAAIQYWWLAFAPLLILVALLAPEGVHGLLMGGRGRGRWTLVRPGIPARPARIDPYRSEAAGTADDRTPVLTVRGLKKSFGSLAVASGYDFDVYRGSLHSFIGPNGAGKTTFFNMLTGLVVPDDGTISFGGKDITRLAMHRRSRLGIGRSFQIVSVFGNLTAFENVRVAVQAKRAGAFSFWRDAYVDPRTNMRVWSILEAVGLTEKASVLSGDLPHGERRLLEIGVTLATDANLLLLDEPLAGLAEADRVRVSALITNLARSHAVVLIEHDIDRVLAMSDRITVLHQGRLIADGKPQEVATNPEVIHAYLGSPPSGAAHNPTKQGERAPSEVVLSASGLVGGYAGGRVLDGVTFTVREGEAVGLLGRNGVGKTTLLRALYGLLGLDDGTIIWRGKDIRRLQPFEINRLGLSMVPEGRRLFPNLTTLDNLRMSMRPGGMSLDEVFRLFPRLESVRHSRAENLSGGERQMAAIARALLAPTSLILLDEPFEGLAPAVVNEVMSALLSLRGRVAMVLVEHHAEQVLSIVDRAVVLVNGHVAWEGAARELEADIALQGRLLGLVEEAAPTAKADRPQAEAEPSLPFAPMTSANGHTQFRPNGRK